MKTCIFITGTNAVGKSALAWAFIERFGGIDHITNDVTYCAEGSVCLAGKYGGTRFGGVDRITNENGASCTSRLAAVVEEGLRNADTIICEGSFMNSFGLNLTNAMFKAERYLLVSLLADSKTIYERLTTRSGSHKRNFRQIMSKQKQAMIAARKWHSIGVKVLQFNTAEKTIEDELTAILKAIGKEDYCNDDK